MRARFAIGLLLGASLAAGPAVADSRATAVVLTFAGPGGARVRDAATRALRGRIDFVPRARAEATARDLGVDLEGPEGRARVAAALGVTLLVAGEVDGRGSQARARLRVYDASGEEVASRSVARPFTSNGRRRWTQATRQAVRDALRAASPREATEAIEVREEEPPEDVEAPPPRAEAEPEPDEDAEPAEARETAAPDAPPRPPYFRLLAGMGGRARLVQIQLEAGGQRRYESGLFLEVPVRLEVRPLAGRGAGAAGFAIRGDFATSALLVSAEPGSSNEVDTTATRFSVHLGYDRRLSRGALYGYAGFGYELFSLASNTVMPSSQIPLVRVALGGRVDLVGIELGLEMEAAYRYVVALGDLGDWFGDGADGFGFDVAAGVGGQISAFTYALRVGFELSYLTFSGDASNALATSGTERGASLTAQIGFQL